MREFSADLGDILKTGLRNREVDDRQALKFLELCNLEPTDSGLVPFNSVVPAFDLTALTASGVEIEHPFPQVFIGSQYGFICTTDSIYTFSLNNFKTISRLTIYDHDNPTVETDLNTGIPWNLIDMGKSWILLNGVDLVYYFNTEGMIGVEDKVYVRKNYGVGCGTYYKGRIVLGGLKPDTFWSGTWQNFWNTWITKKKDTGLDFNKMINGINTLMPVEKNWLWWSTIGGGDVSMLIKGEGMVSGNLTSDYDSSNPLYRAILKRNEQGFACLDKPGSILCIKALGEYIIVYGDYSIKAYKHKDIGLGSTLAPINIPLLDTVGLLNSGAADGDLYHHVFLDSSGTLWELTSDLMAKVLGYKEYFFDMLRTGPKVTYTQLPFNVDTFGAFYITDGFVTYKLVKNGLLKVTQSISSATYMQGNSIGICEDFDREEIGYFTTDILDLNRTGIKTINSIDVICNEDTVVKSGTIKVCIYYRYTQGEAYKVTDWYLCNNEGSVNFPVQAVDFKIKIKVSDYRRFSIGRLIIHFQYNDRRFKRSLDVNQAFS